MNGTEELNDMEEPVKLRIDPEQLARIRKRAEETGQTVEEVFHAMFETHLVGNDTEKS